MMPHRHARARARHDGRADDLLRLFTRCSAGDTGARDTIILRFLPLARRLARGYEGRGEPLEDLCQVASVGLIKAVDRYSPDQNDAFVAYARLMILGELRRHFRDATWRVHVPRGLKDRAQRVARASENIRPASGARAKTEAIATYLDLEPSEVAEAQLAWAAYHPDSLDAPRPSQDERWVARTEVLAPTMAEYERAELSIGIARVLRGLRRRDQTVIMLRLGGGLSQREIGERVGVSQMHISRILRGANASLAAACGLALAA
ncbi:MAG TPA: sigma-70 family RNA polymerase sigma factor [Solirubrobacteraceae bacterium]|jgi:RNA polymerase sigma-B factor|nr:sigma-70 family RNA polymerase sigma factor [Solirubrobacteraceae bacterium]